MYNENLVLAIIPARGGSKSIPGKNIKDLGGKPLISYTIQEALGSKYIDRVIVSTDDQNIANVANEYGAETPFIRPKNIAEDTSTSLSVILHTLKFLIEKHNYSPDIVVFLQPTSPFRTSLHIDSGIEKILDCDAVIGVAEVKHHPYFMMQQEDGLLSPFLDLTNRSLRRQDVPPLYYINASLFITKIDYYNNLKETDPVCPIFAGEVKGVFMDEISSIDINDDHDLLIAECIISSNLLEKKK
ncbi:MAG: acylneuraminate cytidylyltransferase family protein [Thermoplasmata archaeon]|nr:acylneuraminate cytidylyltransferase family protein [Thermoplasmata archaeon]